jgi:hypothetical protein
MSEGTFCASDLEFVARMHPGGYYGDLRIQYLGNVYLRPVEAVKSKNYACSWRRKTPSAFASPSGKSRDFRLSKIHAALIMTPLNSALT